MRTEFLCIYVLRVASGPRVKLASCKSALTPPPPRHPPVFFSTDRSKAVVLVLFLLIVALSVCSVCVVMLTLWSQSSIAAHFAFCFTSCFGDASILVTFNSCPFCFLFYLL